MSPSVGRAILSIGSLGLVLFAAEIALRLLDLGPWSSFAQDAAEPTMNEPDPVLGWRPRSGKYEYPGYVAGEPSIRLTFLEDGRRLSESPELTGQRGALASGARPVILLLGGSYTLGWAISDEETYAWKLQCGSTASREFRLQSPSIRPTRFARPAPRLAP